MYILKAVLIYLLAALFPAMLIYLTMGGLIQHTLIVMLLISVFFLILYSDKLILLFLGAREVIDSDHPRFFQILKTETYKELENLPRVYLYSGHRFKAFVLSLRKSWSIVLDRELLNDIDDLEAKSLIKYLIKYKRENASKSQTVGMGISSLLIRLIYWLGSRFSLNPARKPFKIYVFLCFVMIKPVIEIILKLSVNKTEIFCDAELKPVYLKADKNILNRSFIEFMLMHLETDVNLRENIIEFLEGFPLIENCKFKKLN